MGTVALLKDEIREAVEFTNKKLGYRVAGLVREIGAGRSDFCFVSEVVAPEEPPDIALDVILMVWKKPDGKVECNEFLQYRFLFGKKELPFGAEQKESGIKFKLVPISISLSELGLPTGDPEPMCGEPYCAPR